MPPEEKDPAAVALGKKRWTNVEPEDRADVMRELARRRTASLSARRRVEIARKASAAAAAKRTAAAKARRKAAKDAEKQADSAGN